MCGAKVELGRQLTEATNNIAELRENLLALSEAQKNDKGDVQEALQKVRRDIEVTCETLLEEQMKLRGKVIEPDTLT